MDTLMFALIKRVGLALIMQQCLANGQGITKCDYDYNCAGDTNLGRIYLRNISTSIPFSVLDQQGMYTYFWQPCDDFYIYGINAGAIQQSQSFSTTGIGTHLLASCDAVDGYARFNMKTMDNTRFTFVKCSCGTGDTLTFEGENPSMNFNFMFTSKGCCTPSHGEVTVTVSISAGSVMVIIFFSLLAAYFLFGTLIQIFVRKAQGRERVPNIAAWSALPALIKDGFLFTFTCGKRASYSKM